MLIPYNGARNFADLQANRKHTSRTDAAIFMYVLNVALFFISVSRF